MNYEGTIIRPPSEAGSILLQVSVGCSHNKCTFCGAYKEVAFRLKSATEIDRDLHFAETYCRKQKRLFICDGDGLIIPQHRLAPLFRKIRLRLPWVRRISLYANGRAVRSKTSADLEELKELGLDRVYFGLESGDDLVLERIKKGESARSQAAAAKKLVDAGLFVSTTVLLGIAGVAGGLRHARLTADLLNEIKPAQIAALAVMPLPNTPFGRMVEEDSTILPTPEQITTELKEMIERITIERVQFMANHASNYLPLSGRLQRDKQRLLGVIEAALDGTSPFIPEHARRL